MIIELSNKRVVFSEQVKKVLKEYRQLGDNGKEAGGILLGQISSTDIYVCRASVPSKHDKRSMFEFVRSPKSAQIIVDYEFINSAGMITYLGEWHSHPQDTAQPSSQDQKMIHEQFYENTIQVDKLVMAILGRKKDYVGVYDGSNLYGANCFLDG